LDVTLHDFHTQLVLLILAELLTITD
jgi:hypothetical protein